MGYIARPQPLPAGTVIVPAAIPDWLSWFRWHAQLAGTGAILGPSRGVPEVGPRVVEMLPLAPSFASPPSPELVPSDEVVVFRRGDGTTFELPGPPNPGRQVRH